jgi:hypothetical protein
MQCGSSLGAGDHCCSLQTMSYGLPYSIYKRQNPNKWRHVHDHPVQSEEERTVLGPVKVETVYARCKVERSDEGTLISVQCTFDKVGCCTVLCELRMLVQKQKRPRAHIANTADLLGIGTLLKVEVKCRHGTRASGGAARSLRDLQNNCNQLSTQNMP